MTVEATALARLLRAAGYPDAAAAADLTGGQVSLTSADCHELLTTYTTRRAIQEDAGRHDTVERIRRLLESLHQHAGAGIHVGKVTDDQHHYIVFLSARLDAVVGVVVPPRGP